MADSKGPRPPVAKKLKQSTLLGLFSQSTKCDSSAREPESELKLAMIFKLAKQFYDYVHTQIKLDILDIAEKFIDENRRKAFFGYYKNVC